MAEIKNYTLNFGCGTRFALNFAGAKLACAEIERISLPATGVADG